MFAVNNFHKKVLTKDVSGVYETVLGECTFNKGDSVTLLALTDYEGVVYYGIKKHPKLVIFPQQTFGSYNNFLGAF